MGAFRGLCPGRFGAQGPVQGGAAFRWIDGLAVKQALKGARQVLFGCRLCKRGFSLLIKIVSRQINAPAGCRECRLAGPGLCQRFEGLGLQPSA